MGDTSPLFGQCLPKLNLISRLRENLVNFKSRILKPMCNVYTNYIKTFSNRNMHMYVDASTVRRLAYASNLFLMLPDILIGLTYYK